MRVGGGYMRTAMEASVTNCGWPSSCDSGGRGAGKHSSAHRAGGRLSAPTRPHLDTPHPHVPGHSHQTPVTHFRPHEASVTGCRRQRGSRTIMIIYRGHARACGGVGGEARGSGSVATGAGGVARGPGEWREAQGLWISGQGAAGGRGGGGRGACVKVRPATSLYCQLC